MRDNILQRLALCNKEAATRADDPTGEMRSPLWISGFHLVHRFLHLLRTDLPDMGADRPSCTISKQPASRGTTPAISGIVKLFAAFCLGILLVHNANARLGETAIQFADRYGAPQDTPASKSADKENPLLEGAIHHLYKHQGWQIRAAFLELDGPAVRMEFSKIPSAGASPTIKDSEMRAIAAANKPPGMTWKKTIYDSPDSSTKGPSRTAEAIALDMVGQKMWQRTDGAILWQPVPLIVRIELPAARRHEQIEQRKSQEARGNAPNF